MAEETCLLSAGCAVYRWHELDMGSLVEQEKIGMECQGKMPRAVTRKAESTDVHVCGGLPRSSVEVSVMGMERRG